MRSVFVRLIGGTGVGSFTVQNRGDFTDRMGLSQTWGSIPGRFVFGAKIWVSYHEFTATSLESLVNQGHHPQMALIQVSEILKSTQNDDI